MPDCKFYSAVNMTGSFCTRPTVVRRDQAEIQINTIGSTDFDIHLEASLDQVNWSTIPKSALTNVESADQPYIYRCVKARYVRVCFSVNSGSLDLEAFIR